MSLKATRDRLRKRLESAESELGQTARDAATTLGELESEVDALRLALPASRDEAEKAKAETDSVRFVGNEETIRLKGQLAALAAECEELRADKERLQMIREECKVLYWPGDFGGYPIEHAPKAAHAPKNQLECIFEAITKDRAARADAARKEPPAKAHGCEVGE